MGRQISEDAKPIKLRNVMHRAGLNAQDLQRLMADEIGMKMSIASVRFILRKGYVPRTNFDKDAFTSFIGERFAKFLRELKMKPEDIWQPILTVDDLVDAEALYLAKLKLYTEVTMLRLDTMKHFKLISNPFSLDIRRESEIFMGSSHIFALEVMRETAKTGGFAVITGEVGAGKSTVRRKFFEESNANKSYHIIYPETIDKTKLSAKDILQAIVYDLTESQPKGNKEGLSRQVKSILMSRSKNNETSVLVIEEAHDLPVTTLKFLKRIWEMEDGLRRLMGIILIGQNELETRLYNRSSTEIREVTARTSHARVEALNSELGMYIKHRLSSIKADVNKIITPEAIKILAESMQITDRMGRVQSMAYPLFVNNVMIRLMNYAAEAGEEIITPEIVNIVGV